MSPAGSCPGPARRCLVPVLVPPLLALPFTAVPASAQEAAWSARADLVAVDSDPRLDRIGGSLTVVRPF